MSVIYTAIYYWDNFSSNNFRAFPELFFITESIKIAVGCMRTCIIIVIVIVIVNE